MASPIERRRRGRFGRLAALSVAFVFVALPTIASAQSAKPPGPPGGAAQPSGTAQPGGSMAERRVGSDPAAHGHSVSIMRGLQDEGFDNEAMKRIENLEVEIMCACPRENWSRTLSNCPDACADPQKMAIRSYVREGLDDEGVKDRMVERYGGRVLSSPDRAGWIGVASYAVPIGIVIICILTGVAVVVGWSSRSRPGEEGSSPDGGSSVSDAEMDRIASELKDLE